MIRKAFLFLMILTALVLMSGCVDEVELIKSAQSENLADEELEQERNELEGEWERYLHQHNGSLTISNGTDTGFDFNLHVAAGANTNTLEGRAQLSGNTAYYDVEFVECRIIFELNDDMIEVTETEDKDEDEECSMMGGNGTFFHGEYKKGTDPTEVNFVQQGFLTEKEDKLFREVVGEDYPSFVENMMITHIEADIDGLQTTVTSGFIRGVAAMNAVMMISDRYVYAALPSEEHYGIKFYTNDPRYEDQVPMTIRKWMEDYFFQSEEVTYSYVATQ
ncbi:hypothetical protein [Planococcus sp. SSTMD024]|uniref:hypothetical protein n=1 Tax=Planococcus sp. SSTMD024 TaxID=3242163 RepID=UPI00351DC603